MVQYHLNTKEKYLYFWVLVPAENLEQVVTCHQ